MQPVRIIAGVDQLPRIAGELLQAYPGVQLWLLVGTLGAGKTALAGELLCAWGAGSGPFASPTFLTVVEYATPTGPAWHADMYRQDTPEAAAAALARAGLPWRLAEEQGMMLVEWPGRLHGGDGALPTDAVLVRIAHTADGQRSYAAQLLPAGSPWPADDAQ